MFVIFGTPECDWCVKAASLLLSLGMSYDYVDISMDSEAKAFVKGQGHQTVPQVYWEHPHMGLRHIGGYEDLAREVDAYKKDVHENDRE